MNEELRFFFLKKKMKKKLLFFSLSFSSFFVG